MPTIKDVARASGVSTATVSYVLNGTRMLLPETHQRVMRAVRELGYHPSAVARSLNHKRLHTLGLLFGIVNPLEMVTNPYASGIQLGVLTAAAKAGYNVTLFTERWRSAEQSAPGFSDGRTDGVLVVAPTTDVDIIPGLAALNLPLVAISADGTAYGVPSVEVDNAAGTRLAVSHLRALGHRRISHLAGPQNLYSGVIRRASFYEAAAGDEEILPTYVMSSGYDGREAYAQTRHLLALPTPPTAIFAANDFIALSALAAARDAGVPVPERLSIVGFDDDPAGALVRPALTTIHQPVIGLGETAASLLIHRLTGGTPASGMTLLEPTLIVRGTTMRPTD